MSLGGSGGGTASACSSARVRRDVHDVADRVQYYNLAATRLRWASERAVEAGRQAEVARATEPPAATDAPT